MFVPRRPRDQQLPNKAGDDVVSPPGHNLKSGVVSPVPERQSTGGKLRPSPLIIFRQPSIRERFPAAETRVYKRERNRNPSGHDMDSSHPPWRSLPEAASLRVAHGHFNRRFNAERTGKRTQSLKRGRSQFKACGEVREPDTMLDVLNDIGTVIFDGRFQSRFHVHAYNLQEDNEPHPLDITIFPHRPLNDSTRSKNLVDLQHDLFAKMIILIIERLSA